MAIKLTQLTNNSGCGCKIGPDVLASITSILSPIQNSNLIVGREYNDDAAVYKLNDDQYLISTTDFFSPIVDSPYDYGAIAVANSVSDVYAMGGKPFMALAIMGMPIEKIGIDNIQSILLGANEALQKINVPLAGGHSIESVEPFFGLVVHGLADKNTLKKNNTLQLGDLICMTKKIGTGILAMANKLNKIQDNDFVKCIESMQQMNTLGLEFSSKPFVHAMTDITGFGLLGHLLEMLSNTNYSIELINKNIPTFENLSNYRGVSCTPNATYRNWNKVSAYCNKISGDNLLTLCDPQTNGGLLFSIKNTSLEEVIDLGKTHNQPVSVIGEVKAAAQTKILVLE